VQVPTYYLAYWDPIALQLKLTYVSYIYIYIYIQCLSSSADPHKVSAILRTPTMSQQFCGPPQCLSNSADPNKVWAVLRTHSPKFLYRTLTFKVQTTVEKKLYKRTSHSSCKNSLHRLLFPHQHWQQNHVRKTRRKSNYVQYYCVDCTQLVEPLTQRRNPDSAMRHVSRFANALPTFNTAVCPGNLQQKDKNYLADPYGPKDHPMITASLSICMTVPEQCAINCTVMPNDWQH
jgi:hypothetical protein